MVALAISVMAEMSAGQSADPFFKPVSQRLDHLMKHNVVIASTIFLMVGAFAAPMASADCDLSGATCAQTGKKCNIHFKNRTGDTGGSDGSSSLNQNSAAQAVSVKAVDEHNNKVGNKLVIQAWDKKTMNISKRAKKGFDGIRITSDNAPVMYNGSKIKCADIVETLNGTGICKLFHGTRKRGGEIEGIIGYQCDGGDVGGPD